MPLGFKRCPPPFAFIIPALNEEAALAPLLDGLRAALDAAACADADIIVVDDGSRDATASVARKHGARVVSEPRRYWGEERYPILFDPSGGNRVDKRRVEQRSRIAGVDGPR